MSGPGVRRETTNILLVLVGGALVKITVNGTYLRYVKPSVRPWALIAGVVMVLLGLIAIVQDIRAGGARSAPDEHDHQHGSRAVLLLLLPILAIFLVAPPPLGADSVTRDAGRTAPVVTQQGASAFPPLPRGAVVPISLSEFITRSVWDSTNSLNNRVVALTGFVVHEHGVLYLARLVITCCAADATPMKVALAGGDTAGLSDDQWIQSDGLLRPGSATQANEYTPTLRVSSLTRIAEPADPYEY
jgi:uncharacterized repeat protein (TIGR03943 family)